MGGWGVQSRPETFGIDAYAYWDWDTCCGGSPNSSGARRYMRSKLQSKKYSPTRLRSRTDPEPWPAGPGQKIMKNHEKSRKKSKKIEKSFKNKNITLMKCMFLRGFGIKKRKNFGRLNNCFYGDKRLGMHQKPFQKLPEAWIVSG